MSLIDAVSQKPSSKGQKLPSFNSQSMLEEHDTSTRKNTSQADKSKIQTKNETVFASARTISMFNKNPIFDLSSDPTTLSQKFDDRVSEHSLGRRSQKKMQRTAFGNFTTTKPFMSNGQMADFSSSHQTLKAPSIFNKHFPSISAIHGRQNRRSLAPTS